MLNHYSRPTRVFLRLLPIFFLSFFVIVSCNKSSNQLKPFYDTVSFSKTVSHNGSTVLLVDFEQKMYVGTDSLIITISNPTGDTIHNWTIFMYVEKADEFDQTLDYPNQIFISQLAPQEEKTIVFKNYTLPLEESEIKIGLLIKEPNTTNAFSGVWEGVVGYQYGSDTAASVYSFGKGVVFADGKFNFWMKQGTTNKKLSGQFINTTSMNSIYQATPEFTAIEGSLDTVPVLTATNLKMRVKLQGQPGNIENKLFFNLYK